MRRVNYGRSNVRDQIARGQIPPELGMSMIQEMNSITQPMMVRAREVPLLAQAA